MNKERTPEQNTEFDYKFAASVFLTAEYALRHVLIDPANLLPVTALRECLDAFIKIKSLKCSTHQLFRALIDFTLYQDEASYSTFSSLFYNRYIALCNDLTSSIVDAKYDSIVEKLYRQLKCDSKIYHCLEKVCRLSIENGCYHCDIEYLHNQQYIDVVPNIEWLLENSFSILPKSDILNTITSNLKFIDKSNVYTYIDDFKLSNNYIFLFDFENSSLKYFNNKLNDLKKIYGFYNLDNAISSKEPHKYFDFALGKSVFPHLYDHMDMETITNKLFCLVIWDNEHFHQIPIDLTLRKRYPTKPDYLLGNYKEELRKPLQLTRRCIDAGKIITTRQK